MGIQISLVDMIKECEDEQEKTISESGEEVKNTSQQRC
jgi:hypothetical protein